MEACDGKKKLALIAGRAGSNPQLLREVIDKGVSGVYLEKPGAPSVEKLEEMAAYADAKGVPVYMGYNKNVTKYVVEAIEADAKAGKVHWTYIDIHLTYTFGYIY
jgi:predicted dehydrogenase